MAAATRRQLAGNSPATLGQLCGNSEATIRGQVERYERRRSRIPTIGRRSRAKRWGIGVIGVRATLRQLSVNSPSTAERDTPGSEPWRPGNERLPRQPEDAPEMDSEMRLRRHPPSADFLRRVWLERLRSIHSVASIPDSTRRNWPRSTCLPISNGLSQRHGISAAGRSPSTSNSAAGHTSSGSGAWLTKSRRYSTTLGALRSARAEWSANRRDPALASPVAVVVKDWRYLGRGWENPGDEWLARTGAVAVAQARVLAREARLGERDG